MDESDRQRIAPIIRDFGEKLGIDPAPLIASDYTRIVPASARPFAGKYCWE
jgi:hypothetical protein